MLQKELEADEPDPRIVQGTLMEKAWNLNYAKKYPPCITKSKQTPKYNDKRWKEGQKLSGFHLGPMLGRI